MYGGLLGRLSGGVLSPPVRCFGLSVPLCKVNQRRGKNVDPAVEKRRDEKKKKKYEKALRKMGKHDRILRPIDEIQSVSPEDTSGILRPAEPLSPQTQETRDLLFKDWSRYCKVRHLKEIARIDQIIHSQKKALDQLLKISPELYVKAIQFDPDLIPLDSFKGPVVSPPIADYIQDGNYRDVTKNYEIKYPDMKKHLEMLVRKKHKKKKKSEDEEEVA